MYSLVFDYGFHRNLVHTNKKDFYKVIDDLSTEFTITVLKLGCLCTEYYITNYYGDLQMVGMVLYTGDNNEKRI